MVGLKVNVAERIDAAADAATGPSRWRVTPNEALAALPGLTPGVAVHRSHDHAWEQRLARKSAERRVGVRARFAETASGFALVLEDEDGICAMAEIEGERRRRAIPTPPPPRWHRASDGWATPTSR